MNKIEHKEFKFEVKNFDEETGRFSGYASTWDIDLGNDRVVKGAFLDCIEKKDFNDIDILSNHDSRLIIGEVKGLHEDEKGLFLEGQLFVDDIKLAQETRFLMKKDKLKSMSIGYMIETKAFEDGVRLLKKIDLIEVSIVKRPMNPEAAITTVKSVDDLPEFKSLSDIEDFLKSLGCSNNAATAVISNVKKISTEGEPQENADQGDPESKEDEPQEVHVTEEYKEASSALDKLINELQG